MMSGPKKDRRKLPAYDPWRFALVRYEQAMEDARRKMPRPSPRMQFEIRRKAWHVLGAIVAVPVFMFAPYLVGLGILLGAIVLMTIAHFVRKRRAEHPNRRDELTELVDELTEPLQKVLEETKRPGEDYPWAPVTFALALIIIGSIIHFAGFPKAYAYASFIILGVGDAASALIGIPYGRHKLPWNPKKSLEGTTAGVLTGYAGAFLGASLHYVVVGALVPPAWLLIAFAGALAGSLMETLPRLQDNLFVPGSALAAMLAVGSVFGAL